jgi:hypothetical protein
LGYHLTGIVSSLVFLLCLAGLFAQLRLIWTRKRLSLGGKLADGRATDVLSLNQFASSFLAFYSFFVYGFVIERFNHYLVWPRLLASLLTLAILFEIMTDRHDKSSVWVFVTCFAAALVAVAALVIHPAASVSGRYFSLALVVVSTLMVSQGYAHQIHVIRRTGRTGGVSLRMHQLTFLKDLSTLLLGAAMGLKTGWPLLLMNGTCALIKLSVLWQFRWARVSPVAHQRRLQVTAPALNNQMAV